MKIFFYIVRTAFKLEDVTEVRRGHSTDTFNDVVFKKVTKRFVQVVQHKDLDNVEENYEPR